MSLERNNYLIPAEAAAIVDNFEQITDIVRPSGKEEQMKNWIIERAQKKCWEFRVDKKGNLAVNISASPGYENTPRAIMQCHMDMVTFEGKNDKNPTQAYIDNDGWIKTRGGTTLGADNGLGIATAMAIAEDENFQHGPMTLLFTVHEEDSPMGALELDPEIVPADAEFLINLDCEEGTAYICKASTGSQDVDGVFEIGEKEKLPENYRLMEIDLSGLQGAHSGTEIHEQRVNAIKVLNKLLLRIGGFKLFDYKGGEARNVIPAKAKCTIGIPGEEYEIVEKIVRDFETEMKKKGDSEALFFGKAHALQIKTSELPSREVMALSDDLRNRLLRAIEAIPNGVFETMEADHGGGVTLSSNIGVVGQNLSEANTFEMQVMTRAQDMMALAAKSAEVAEIMGYNGAKEVKLSQPDESWVEEEDSPAVNAAISAAGKVGLKPMVFPYNAVLECGAVKKILSIPGRKKVSAVSVGSDIKDAHSEFERASIQSIADTHRYIRAILEKIWGII